MFPYEVKAIWESSGDHGSAERLTEEPTGKKVPLEEKLGSDSAVYHIQLAETAKMNANASRIGLLSRSAFLRSTSSTTSTEAALASDAQASDVGQRPFESTGQSKAAASKEASLAGIAWPSAPSS